jgi:hypothetical protein
MVPGKMGAVPPRKGKKDSFPINPRNFLAVRKK